MTKIAVITGGILLIICISCTTKKINKIDSPYVLLISLDGFRYDYAKKFSALTLLEFQKKGSYALGFRPPYPSKTFPSHYSIITGKYPGEHGIVANSFYNKNIKKYYQLSDRSAVKDHRFYKGKPIWTVLEKHGIKTSPFFWPGSEAKINGQYPTYKTDYDGEIPNKSRINRVINWFKMIKEERPHFVTLYFSDTDTVGHSFGTNSVEIKKTVAKVDSELSYLFSELNKLEDKINVIIVSDHGMQNILKNEIEYLDDYIDLKNVTYLGGCSLCDNQRGKELSCSNSRI